MFVDSRTSRFPTNFLWGAATSAHQVEGNNHNDWTEWEKLGLVKSREQSGRACGHYERFREDFALAKELGHNAHRFSIEWSRIEPRPGRFDLAAIDHYRQVLVELHRLGLEPLVTLWHFTNPIWIRNQGGWTNRRTIDDFGRYVQAIVDQLGHLITHWVTLNEPTVYTSHGYISAYWPPQKKNYLSAWQAIRNLVTAHRLAYQIIHRRWPAAKVGVANNLNDFAAARPGHLLDQGLRAWADFWHNRWWLNQTYDTQDFLGINYYFHHPLRWRWVGPTKLFAPQTPPAAPQSDLGWEIYPTGLGLVLESVRPYQLPIIISENGVADADDHLRAAFIRDHVAQVDHAIRHGLDVRGYCYWSLLDNFEWREGFTPRFGLVEVDYHTLKRTIRPSAHAYRQLIVQHSRSRSSSSSPTA
ncbi:MAG: glycoside hydrolase family 1 protein [Candidatus Kerfeldbacteria bacterium]|nr:glycoside hydrolase family 1 protein [Candidatus Kerfeldbacteria bacterium]